MAVENSESRRRGFWRHLLVGGVLLVLTVELGRVTLWVAGWTGWLAAFADGSVWYKIGELLIVGPLLVLAVYMPHWSPIRSLTFVSRMRWLIWSGALLNTIALLRLSEHTWWSPWLPILTVIGLFAPVVLKGLALRQGAWLIRLMTVAVGALFILNYGLNLPKTGGLVVYLPTPVPTAASSPQQGWHLDLQYLARELPRRHPDPFAHLSEQEFHQAVEELDQAIPNLQGHEIVTEMMRLITSLGDPSTSMWPWGRCGFRGYPLGLCWYADGLGVVSVSEETRPSHYARVKRIGEVDLDSACHLIRQVIPHRSKARFLDISPGFLRCPELLHALGIIDDMETTFYQFEDRQGKEFVLEVHPLPDTSIEWIEDPDKPVRLWLENANKNYWYRIFDDVGLLYFKYNRCMEDYAGEFSDFSSEIFEFVKTGKINRLVVDFRRNGGGSRALFDDFMKHLRHYPQLYEPGRILGIIDYHANGAAVVNAVDLQQETDAIFFGTPPDFDGNAFWENLILELPICRASVFYPGRFSKSSSLDSASLRIDIPVCYWLRPQNERKVQLDLVMDSIMSYVRNLPDPAAKQ